MLTRSSDPDFDVRTEARRALRDGWTGSAVHSGVFAGAVATLSSLFGGGLAVLQQFSITWLLGLTWLVVASGLTAFVCLEFRRFHKHSRLLRELLADERYYEQALADERQERANMQTRMHRLEAEAHLILAARQLAPQLEMQAADYVESEPK
jgi:hypothetical protein